MKPIVLITGCAGGIGNATAKIFAAANWQVIGMDKVQHTPVAHIHRFLQTDLSDGKAIKAVFTDVKKHEGHLDALVNNAALQLAKPLIETSPDEWDRVMAVNIRAAFLTSKYGHALMKDRGGSIINISSVHAVATSENMAAYVTSKGALSALTRAVALEFAHDNIRVNAILPGAVDTAMLREGLSRGFFAGTTIEEKLAGLGQKHAVGRIGQPSDIGEMALFLADGLKSSFITGQCFIVDGGATTRLSTE